MNQENAINTSPNPLGTVILAENISMHYPRLKNQTSSVKELFVRLVHRQASIKIVKALDDVSLSINKGEVYGIIGKNGSGKSTMLKILSRIIQPTQGRVRIWGKVSPLLGIGAGFHPELTGRENAYIYSALLGRSKKSTDELMSWIIDFAELENFIDDPIRIYSSGMTARLGFAVAIAERPEILLVDEVLSVGDERFKDKCNERFQDFCNSGTTIVFVSHNLGAVREMCSRATWLHLGKSMATGKTNEVLAEYQKYINRKPAVSVPPSDKQN